MAGPTESTVLEIEGRNVPLSVRRSRRARRLALRVDPTSPPEFPVELILPRGVGLAEGMRFARDKQGWVARRLAALPPVVPLIDGTIIEFRGAPLIIRHIGGTGLTRCDGETLLVTGAIEHTSRRAKDWLRARAREALTERSHTIAARIHREVKKVRLGDPKTRWGSCAADGRLAYSWRLILTPDFVLDYVVAHEVAHLNHPNHGPRFWRLVEDLCPHCEAARAWLNRNGPRLLRYG
jgi:predicted metal-dependent hydrolase